MTAATIPANCAGQFDVFSDHAGLAGHLDSAFFLQAAEHNTMPAGPALQDPPGPIIGMENMARRLVRPPAAPPMVAAPAKRKLFMHGFPGSCGGANTEAWHVLRLLARHGVDITILATSAEEPWVRKLEAEGIEIRAGAGSGRLISPEEIRGAPGLAGSPVVSFCCKHFLYQQNATVFRDLKCKRVWVNCMNWMEAAEKKLLDQSGPFEAYVFQSKYQRSVLSPQLVKWGYTAVQGHLIRGAFCVEDFPFRPLPHNKGEPFVVGRLSRPDSDKFSSNQLAIYKQARQAVSAAGGLRARIMAWQKGKTDRKCGRPPEWCQALTANAEPSDAFLQSLHCYCQYNGGAKENWPRSGLEAMATGVPLVVQNDWGWREMVEDGVTGRLCADEVADPVAAIAVYAHDEELRMAHAEAGRKRCEELSDPEVIWAGWEKLLDSLEG
jgi:hypothetical protein